MKSEHRGGDHLFTTTSYKEAYRPQYHYSPPSQWLNDPNGMVFYEGEYHLFYQYHPESNVWGPMHWGHAVSTDLVKWEHLPIALKPDHNGFIFSGSAVVDWKDSSGFFEGGSGLVAIFTHEDTNPETGSSRQRQSLAYSLDKGRTWTMYKGNPVLEDPRFIDFRDPKVFWDEPRQRWAMLLVAGDRVIIYSSPNLADWTLCSEFGVREGSHAGVWECPDLFELPVDGNEKNSKWVLIVSIGDHPDSPEGSRTQYFIGSFDGIQFVNESAPDTLLWLDHGRDNYAGVTWSDVPEQDGRRLLIGWMTNWKYARSTPTDVWRGSMTIPRELELKTTNEGIRLIQKPIREMRALREPVYELHNKQLQSGMDPLQEVKGDCLEIEAEIELEDAVEFGFRVRVSDKEGTVIGFDAENETLFIDRSHSGLTDSIHEQFSCRHDARLIPINNRIKVHIYVDWSSVEVFANDGEIVMTDLIFPEPGSRGLEFYTHGGNVKINSLYIYHLRSIW